MENQKLDDYFGYTEAGSSLQGEMRAGLTTFMTCLLYTSPSPRDGLLSRMPSSA